MNGTGLDHDGFIEREGDLARVPQAFAPVIEATKAAILRAFGPSRLHSAYLYGSIPRGTAVPEVSDLDVLLALHDEPTDGDRAAASRLENDLDVKFPQIDGVGILLYSTATLLSDIERNDLGWFVACLCTPLIGEDLAARLPRYRPTSLLARETNGDLGDLLPHWRDRLGEARTGASLHVLSRGVGRCLVRTGFTLVMPRWGGWTSDPHPTEWALSWAGPGDGRGISRSGIPTAQDARGGTTWDRRRAAARRPLTDPRTHRAEGVEAEGRAANARMPETKIRPPATMNIS